MRTLDYAAAHPGDIRQRIARNRELSERSREIAQERQALLV